MALYDLQNPQGNASTSINTSSWPQSDADKLFEQVVAIFKLQTIATQPEIHEFGEGHHVVPKEIWKKDGKISAEAKAALDKVTTGSVPGGHYFDQAHRGYNRVVSELWKDFTKNINVSQMTSEQVSAFVDIVQNSKELAVTRLLSEIERKQIDAGIVPKSGIKARVFIGLSVAGFIRDCVKEGVANAAEDFVNDMVDPSGSCESTLGFKPTEWNKPNRIEM